MMVDNKEPLSSGEHYSGYSKANWNYTRGIASSDFYKECQSGLMTSLSSINSNVFKDDDLIAVCASPSAVYYKPDAVLGAQEKAGGFNWEWLIREHNSTHATMTFTKNMIRFNTPFNELPMMNDIRTVNVRLDLEGRFSSDTGWYDYSDFMRDSHYTFIRTNGGIDFGLITIRAVLKNCQIVSGCLYVDTVFPRDARSSGIEAPDYCFPDNHKLTCVYFNGDSCKNMNIFGGSSSNE